MGVTTQADTTIYIGAGVWLSNWIASRKGVTLLSGDHPSMKEVLHPLTLKFVDKRIEDEYEVSNMERFFKQQRFVVWLQHIIN